MTLTRREILAAAFASAGTAIPRFQGLRATERVRFSAYPFSLGVASGYPTPTSVVLWTRLAPAPLQPDGGMPQALVPVQWEIATDSNMKSIVRRGVEYATPEWAHSVHVEPAGLEAGREYWYRFTSGGARSPIGRTRTAPAAGATLTRLRLAVASCQQYEHGYYNAYRHMLEDDLDLILHVGDYIYELSWGEERDFVRRHETSEAYTLEDYRTRYALYKSDPDLAAAHAAYPWLVTWDDHEVDNDYADTASEENDNPELLLARRAAAYRAYYEHMPLPRRAVPFGANMRLHAQRACGDLASIFMLDQRQYRSPQACPRSGFGGGRRVNLSDCPELEMPARTMLGERQESWLLAELNRSRTRWNLLAQGVVMAHFNEDKGGGRRYWTDSWNGYPAARERLMGFLAERQIANPVVLSGDIHAFMASGVNLKADNLASPVVASEFVTTSVSSQRSAVKGLNEWRSQNPNILLARDDYRGYLRLELSHERLTADLIAMDEVKSPRSERHTLASFVVESGKPTPVVA